MVPASFDLCLANLNREASSAGTSIPSQSLNPTACVQDGPRSLLANPLARSVPGRRSPCLFILAAPRWGGPAGAACPVRVRPMMRLGTRSRTNGDWNTSHTLSKSARLGPTEVTDVCD